MPPPSLTAVEINYRQVAAMLDLLMRGRRLPARHEVLQPAGVIARDSTDYFAMEDPDIVAAMRFIERNLTRRIGVKDVVAGTGVSSRRRLERRFRDTCGRSIAAEIRRLRILKAKRLLSETALLVKQVAQQSGFGDPIRLHEVFVREVGMAPSAYRERAASGGGNKQGTSSGGLPGREGTAIMGPWTPAASPSDNSARPPLHPPIPSWAVV